MKILDKYILKSFLTPFFATFFIVLFVLVMQVLWLAFDEIAGKGIDLTYILKFLFYTCMQASPTAFPIGVLLSSIMALGNLSERYESAAIKAAGISFRRFMRPLVFLVIIISGINFVFLNNIYPYASLKQRNLLANMRKQKPALALVEGSFNNDIPGYSIKFDKKYGENENLLKNVLILDLKKSKKNDKIITAEYGEITSKPGSKYMTLNLFNGRYFEDHTEQRNNRKRKLDMPASHVTFEKYTVNLDISMFSDQNLDLEKYKNHYMMLSIDQLSKQSDSMKTAYDKYLKAKAKIFFDRSMAKELVPNDSLSLAADSLNINILENFELKEQKAVVQAALTKIKSPIRTVSVFKNNYKNKRKYLNLYDFEFHYRLAFSLSCLVLFFVGAPLGSLIRKGGFGLPMVLAIIIFVFYFFSTSMGKNIAEESKITAQLGGWVATMLLTPIGLFLTYRATKGMGIINFDKITVPFNNLIKRFKKNKTDE